MGCVQVFVLELKGISQPGAEPFSISLQQRNRDERPKTLKYAALGKKMERVSFHKAAELRSLGL
jgi:hypothetical protein